MLGLFYYCYLPFKGGDLKASYNQLSEMTGMTYRTIKGRLNGMDPVGTGKNNALLFETKDVLPVLYGDPAVHERLNLEQERARLAKEQADRVEMENAKERKELLPADEVEPFWAAVINNAKTLLLGLPAKIAPLAAELQDPVKIQKEATVLVKDALAELAEFKVK